MISGMGVRHGFHVARRRADAARVLLADMGLGRQAYGPNRRLRRRRERVGPHHRWPWLLLLGACAVAAGLGGWLRAQPDGRLAVVWKRAAGFTVPAVAAAPASPADLPAAEVARRFLAARTNLERLRWVRDPQRVRPALEAFYDRGPGASERFAAIEELGPARMQKMTYQRFEVRLAGKGRRLLCVVPGPRGGKVDFECYARQGSVPWETLLSTPPTEPAEVRVFVEAGSGYAGGFSDAARWRNFTATTPDLDHPVECYAVRGSQAEATLASLVTFGPTRATLAIRPLADSHARRQFQVVKVLAAGWVVEDLVAEPLSAGNHR